MNTVNVIEYFEESIASVNSFKDDEKGNKKAEQLFTKIVKKLERTNDKEYIADCIDDGIYENDDGYQCFLVHAS